MFTLPLLRNLMMKAQTSSMLEPKICLLQYRGVFNMEFHLQNGDMNPMSSVFFFENFVLNVYFTLSTAPTAPASSCLFFRPPCKRSSYSFIRKDEQILRGKSTIHSPHFFSPVKSIPSSELAMPWTSERREAGRGGVENLTRGRWKCVS